MIKSEATRWASVAHVTGLSGPVSPIKPLLIYSSVHSCWRIGPGQSPIFKITNEPSRGRLLKTWDGFSENQETLPVVSGAITTFKPFTEKLIHI
jgi:hypothetical protein